MPIHRDKRRFIWEMFQPYVERMRTMAFPWAHCITQQPTVAQSHVSSRAAGGPGSVGNSYPGATEAWASAPRAAQCLLTLCLYSLLSLKSKTTAVECPLPGCDTGRTMQSSTDSSTTQAEAQNSLAFEGVLLRTLCVLQADVQARSRCLHACKTPSCAG